ncbi:hypothetical protein J6R97_04455 [bacterium]|nr:hypothetical protein [bacterium]
MDLIKKLTGKNPSEYEMVAEQLVNNSDVNLFSKLVKQDDFLFDFIKDNVAKRIQNACNKTNYLNLLNFLEFYSASYDTMIARVLYSFSGDELLPEMKEYYLNGTDAQKAYAVKYFSFVTPERLVEILPLLRQTALSSYEPLATNSIEVLSILKDEQSKLDALEKLKSEDEFEQFAGIKFLVAYQAKDAIIQIVEVMKKSSLSENIALEILYLMPLEKLLERDFDTTMLVLCNIINGIPEIVSPTIVCDINLYELIENLPLTSTSSVFLRLAKEKFAELCSNDEYLFDCDKNTKDEVNAIFKLLDKFNNNKLESLFYDELYEESDFVFFALDFVNEIDELDELIDSNNETLILKVLTLLKEKNALNQDLKNKALFKISNVDIKNIIEVL